MGRVNQSSRCCMASRITANKLPTSSVISYPLALVRRHSVIGELQIPVIAAGKRLAAAIETAGDALRR